MNWKWKEIAIQRFYNNTIAQLYNYTLQHKCNDYSSRYVHLKLHLSVLCSVLKLLSQGVQYFEIILATIFFSIFSW